MILIKLLPTIICAGLFSSVVSADQTYSHINESDLYGGWNCKLSIKDEITSLFMDYNVNYIRNGTSNSFGVLRLKLPELPEIKYSVTTSMEWEINKGYLIETTKEVKLVNRSHPELEGIINLQSMFPQNMSESSEVLTLNKSLLKAKTESNGMIYSCNKYLRKS